MTIISLTTNFGNPILIGDLLITSKKGNAERQIPSFLGDVKEFFPNDKKNYPIDLKQKIYIIEEKIALGLAGNVYQMKEFLDDIQIFFKYQLPSEENFLKFMDNYDYRNRDECSILVFIIDEEFSKIKPIVHVYGNWEEFSDPQIEVGILIGSGKDAFKRKLQSLKIDCDQMNVSRGINFSLLPLILAEENQSLNSILEAWGAGFQLIEFVNGKFKKLDEYTIVVCKSTLTNSGKSMENDPYLIMYYKYYGEVLIINSILYNEFKRYGVLPLNLKKENIDESLIPEFRSFESSIVLCTFVLEESGESFFTTVLHEGNEKDDRLKVRLKSNRVLEVIIGEEISESVAKKYNESLSP